MAIPLAWLLAQGLESGFRSWEKIILAAGFMVPALSRTLATAVGVPTGPLVVAAVLWLVLRRWLEASDAPKATEPVASAVV